MPSCSVGGGVSSLPATCMQLLSPGPDQQHQLSLCSLEPELAPAAVRRHASPSQAVLESHNSCLSPVNPFSPMISPSSLFAAHNSYLNLSRNQPTLLPRAQASEADEWEPRRGWQDFDPHATLVLHHLSQDPNGPPLRVTGRDMRHLDRSFMPGVFQCFVARAAPLLVEADGDFNSPAAAELKVCTRGKTGIGAGLWQRGRVGVHWVVSCCWRVQPMQSVQRGPCG